MSPFQRRIGALGFAALCAACAGGASAQNSFFVQQSGAGPGTASVWSAPGSQSVVSTTGPLLAPAPPAALRAPTPSPSATWSPPPAAQPTQAFVAPPSSTFVWSGPGSQSIVSTTGQVRAFDGGLSTVSPGSTIAVSPFQADLNQLILQRRQEIHQQAVDQINRQYEQQTHQNWFQPSTPLIR